MSRLNNVQREVTRGEILRALAEAYPRWITYRSLLNLLDYAGYSTLKEDLNFHLEYMKGKKLVDYQIRDRGVGEGKEISLIRITTDGIDLLDRRKKGETGVRI